MAAKRPARNKAPPAPSTARAISHAGISSAAVLAATGRGWAAWFTLLAREGAATMTHADIAKLLATKHAVPAWWSQMITVGYEHATKQRAVGQTQTGWQASRSKTFTVSVTKLYKAWSDPKLRAKWCPEKGLVVRTATANKSLRMTWSDGRSSVEADFLAKGEKKSSVGVTHRKLDSAKDVATMKARWGEMLEALGKLLAG